MGMQAPRRAFPLPKPLAAAGRYALKHKLAQGGMGTIYLAHDRLAERPVAYKRLRTKQPERAARVTALFEREYHTLAQLAHPNIVHVYEYGVDHDGPFYTMEVLSGTDLKAAGRKSTTEACRVVRDVASALALVHTRRVVHRDVSPHNIRLCDDGRVKLIDFGALTPFGRVPDVVGTPGFIAPECLDGSELDGRVDLYSLGATFYWMLTGAVPHKADSFRKLKDSFALPIPAPSSYGENVPPALDELVLSLLSVDPLARPASASELIDRITDLAKLAPERNEKRVARSYLRHPPLVGREQVLSEVSSRLDATFNESGSAVLVQGLSGTGKTALLDRVTLDAQLSGALVLRAQGGAQPTAFGLARSLLRSIPAAWGKENSLWLLDTSAQADAAGALDLVELHTRKVSAVTDELRELSRAQPTILLIDDLHRADPESAAALALLSQEVCSRRLMLVLTVAEGTQLDAATRAAFEHATQLSLGPLDADAIIELLTRTFGEVPHAPQLGRWLYRHSGGNPARCIALLESLIQRESIQYVSGIFTLPAADVSAELTGDAVLGRLAQIEGLSPVAKAVTECLSLQQSSISLHELAVASELPGRDVARAVDELRHQGIVWLTDGQTAFVSDTLRSAVAGSLAEDDRKHVHMRVANALLNRTARDEGVELLAAQHMLRAGAKEQATALLVRAAQSKNPGADSIGNTRTALLELSLDALHQQGYADEQSLGILVSLAHAGFFRDYSLQLRYLPRALQVLARLSGVQLAQRLRPVLGRVLSLYAGLLTAFVRHVATRRGRRAGSFRQLVRNFLTLANTGSSAALCAFDFPQARQILHLLEPFSAARYGTGPWLSHQFSLASLELGTGLNEQGGKRSAELLTLLKADGKIPGLDAGARSLYRMACLYGKAQAELSRGSAVALELSGELATGHPFYASHAESIRMAYHALRGEQAQADEYRKRAELAALQGGMSWSAMTILATRQAYTYMLTQNAVGLVHTVSELEELMKQAPNLVLIRDLSRGYLALLRGRSERALRLYQRVMSDERWESLPTAWLDRMCYARVLVRVGRLTDAKRECERAQQHAPREDGGDIRVHLLSQQLALTEAALGDVGSAFARLARCEAKLRGVDNPLLLGSLHRDTAQVALIAQDGEKLVKHLTIMTQQFKRTQNPWLIRQCEQLAAEAKRLNVAGQAWVPLSELPKDALAALAHASTGDVPVSSDTAPLPPTRSEGSALSKTAKLDE